MTFRRTLKMRLSPIYNRSRSLKKALKQADVVVDRARHSLARVYPEVIQPNPRKIYITLTAACNNRCKGCRYGRDFMQGHSLALDTVKDLLDDASALGFTTARFYGGEPLLHRNLPEIIQHATRLGLYSRMTTNGVLLDRKIDALFESGLRDVSVGLYGIGDSYDEYVQIRNRYDKVVAGIDYARRRYGKRLSLKLDWLLMRPTCNPESLDKTFALAIRYDAPLYVNLIHYSLPYFVGPEESALHFKPEDRRDIEALVDALLEFKKRHPGLILNSEAGLRSIPDWLILGPNMRVPCSEYRLIWVGADGTVQMCYVTFKLGNLNEKRLSEMLFTSVHRKAAQDAFKLNCPNCHCGYDARILRHRPAVRRYS